jgi:hydrogenase-4 component B
MYLIVFSVVILTISGLLALILSRYKSLSSYIAVTGVWAGSILALFPVVATFTANSPKPLYSIWNVPWGSLYIALDGLSAFFLLPVIILSPLTAFYGYSYLSHKNKPLGASWFFFNILVASMILLISAQNGILFLMAWEVMALSSFFLVMFDHENLKVREAGWIYLVATHIGTAFLLAFFSILAVNTGSLDFDKIASSTLTPILAGTLFILAVIGFGTKAGFMPLHVWLPEAHPAAPSHVSSLMSGVMIKMGIYGLLRALTFMGTPPSVWGWTLVIIGAVSGIFGVLFALAQHDIKRLLAYHSVENIGIITLGIGTGVLGMSWNEPSLIILGFGGGILHVLNHALFKGLLFLGAGAVINSSGTHEIDRMGGLLKKMPWTGVTFLIGAAAISGLPPLNGFVSEFLIYSAGFHGALSGTPEALTLAAILLVSLAIIGGLAAACFTKCFGIVFLGEPRETHTTEIQDVSSAMRWPMIALAAGCIIIGLTAPLFIRLVFPAIQTVAGLSADSMASISATESNILGNLTVVLLILIALTGALFLIRRLLPMAKEERLDNTWGCGYAKPTPRMQYSASSFAQPLIDLFRICLGTLSSGKAVKGFFPGKASFSTHTSDMAQEKLFRPLFQLIERLTNPLRMLQHGGIHLYVLYIFITLVAILVWKVGFMQ